MCSPRCKLATWFVLPFNPLICAIKIPNYGAVNFEHNNLVYKNSYLNIYISQK